MNELIEKINKICDIGIGMIPLEANDLLNLINELRIQRIKLEEKFFIDKLKLDNEQGQKGLIMKEDTIVDDKGKEKNKYTDTTLKMALSNIYLQDDIKEIETKYKIELLKSTEKRVDDVVNLWKKVLDIK